MPPKRILRSNGSAAAAAALPAVKRIASIEVSSHDNNNDDEASSDTEQLEEEIEITLSGAHNKAQRKSITLVRGTAHDEKNVFYISGDTFTIKAHLHTLKDRGDLQAIEWVPIHKHWKITDDSLTLNELDELLRSEIRLKCTNKPQ